MGVLDQEIQAWVAREHPDMVEVEMDTWFHTTYPDVERRLEDFFYEIAAWSRRAHPRPEPPRVSWSDIRPASIATEIVREEPRSEEEQIDFNELLRQSMDICYPPAQATQAPPEDATVIESKECLFAWRRSPGPTTLWGSVGTSSMRLAWCRVCDPRCMPLLPSTSCLRKTYKKHISQKTQKH